MTVQRYDGPGHSYLGLFRFRRIATLDMVQELEQTDKGQGEGRTTHLSFRRSHGDCVGVGVL